MPYRQQIEPDREPDAPDMELVPVAVLLWFGSVALCVLRIARGEPLEGESAMAALCCLALPYALLRGIKKV